MEPTFALARLVVGFFRTIWGSVQKPYVTYRALVTADPYQLLILFTFIGAYFFLVSPLKVGLHPFLLTINTARLFTAAIGTYLAICLFFLFLGKVFKREVNLRAVMLTWGYSLVPTLLWFFTTSVFYVLLPPPRHETWPGRIFSLMFITFSLSLFFWKGLLYYLTLRFALKLDLKRIALVSSIFFPALVMYSIFMYQLGVFRVPFV